MRVARADVVIFLSTACQPTLSSWHGVALYLVVAIGCYRFQIPDTRTRCPLPAMTQSDETILRRFRSRVE